LNLFTKEAVYRLDPTVAISTGAVDSFARFVAESEVSTVAARRDRD